MAVYIAQCLCPQRHAIIAAADEADSEADAERVRTALRRQVISLLKSGALNGWCAICGAKRATWRYEVRRTVFATMAEALPHLQQVEAENIGTNLVYGDLERRQRPN